jgi:hypothetical protein
MSAKPITPKEIVTQKLLEIPDCVIETFNHLIAEKWDGYKSSIKQCDIVEILVSKHNMDENIIYHKHYLDIEGIYRKAGWVVEYDKPAYNESYDAYFTFRKKE